MAETDPLLLRLERLEKVFPNGTIALAGVDLTIRRGVAHGLLGAHDAGKSTLIRILSGALPATAGSITWQGHPVRWRRPAQAREAGIATLYQHIPLVGALSALENIFLGARAGWASSRDERARLRRLLGTIGCHLELDSLVSDLPIGQRQMVAILQALAAKARLIIMDEPTASLTAAERAVIYRTIQHLTRTEGRSVLFVSHFLDEILDLTDEVTVLREGVVALHSATVRVDETRIAEAVAGRPMTSLTRGAGQSFT